jgi:hypothetical protein
MPPQFLDGQTVIDASAVVVVGFATMGISLIFSSVLKSLLNLSLGVISNLTIIAHFFLISYTIPANLLAFIETLFPLITLDFLHLTELLDPVFKFSELDLKPLSYNCGAVGYDNALLVPNLAEKFYLIFFMPLILLMIA